jgi:methionine synthase II (cobalamin-independent)
MTSVAPGSASRIGNEYYKTDDEFLFACADAMREEYKAIIDAGLILQLDDRRLRKTGTRSTLNRRSRNTGPFRCAASRR